MDKHELNPTLYFYLFNYFSLAWLCIDSARTLNIVVFDRYFWGDDGLCEHLGFSNDASYLSVKTGEITVNIQQQIQTGKDNHLIPGTQTAVKRLTDKFSNQPTR